MMNPISNMMMNQLQMQLKAKNPQAFQMVNQAMQNKNNPMELFKQVTSNFDDKTRNEFFNQAKQMGFSDDLLNQVQNGINA